MYWNVQLTKKAGKQLKGLPEQVTKIVKTLIRDIELSGPVRGNWPNYSPLKGKGDSHHCHLKRGKPAYVAVWEVLDKQIKDCRD